MCNSSAGHKSVDEPGTDAIQKFTPSLGIPDLGVQTPKQELGVRSWEPLVTPKSGLLNL